MGFSKVLLIDMSSGCKTLLLSPALAARGVGQSTLQGLSGDSCRLPCASLLCPAAFSTAGHRRGGDYASGIWGDPMGIALIWCLALILIKWITSKVGHF